MNFALTKISSNRKTGPIATSMTAKDSCPDTCPLKIKGCYAKYGPTNMHWTKISNGERGVDQDQFFRELKALPAGKLFRHNVAGDLPHKNGTIDREFVEGITKATKRVQGFTYTHHVHSAENLKTIKTANSAGFTINLSHESPELAVESHKAGNPSVTLLTIDAPNVQKVNGVDVVACPAEKSDKVTCESCRLCAKADRDYVIGFRAHGTAKKTVNIIARG